jgi:hypothetical protein
MAVVERQSCRGRFHLPWFPKAGRLRLPRSTDGVSQNGKVGRNVWQQDYAEVDVYSKNS